MHKPLEVPYNFDKNLISFLKIYDPEGALYHCIYIAPFWEDYISAKYYYNHSLPNNGNGRDMNNNRRMTREEYISHVENINYNFPNKLMLLLQQNNTLMDSKILDFYINQLKITKFCVGSIEQAKVLKTINKNFEIVGSITMKIEPKDLQNPEYEKYFDSFVLWFPYNRDIEKVVNLPKNFKYILLVNCGCSIYCDGTHHWFAKNPEEDRHANCPRQNPEYDKLENTIFVRPVDLPVWDNIIDYYKLQGREYTTKTLIKDIVLYSVNYDNYNINNINYDLYYKKQNKDKILKLYKGGN